MNTTKGAAMNDKELTEYSQWMWSETGKLVLQAVAIYAVVLGAYWIFVG
jgi:hypothetical protein